MQLTNEQIQAILDGATDGAGNYHTDFKQYYGGTCARNLDDLREILHLRKEIDRLRELLKLIQIEGGLGTARHRQIDRALAEGEKK